jgi:hypothetical protein
VEVNVTSERAISRNISFSLTAPDPRSVFPALPKRVRARDRTVAFPKTSRLSTRENKRRKGSEEQGISGAVRLNEILCEIALSLVTLSLHWNL